MKKRTYATTRVRVISYARVSTSAQAASGLGTDAQHQAVEREAQQRGWQVIDQITDEAISGTTPSERRPLLRTALERLRSGDAEVLAVARADRLARSTIELLRLYERAEAEGWTIVALDAPADLSGPEGRMLIGVRAVFAEFEADMARARTKDALHAARLRGQRFGRPSRHTQATKELASRLRDSGHSLGQIAAALTSAGIATPSGNTVWSRSSVQSLLRTIGHDEAARAQAQALESTRDKAEPPSEDAA